MCLMKCKNVGCADRSIRLIIGLALVSLVFVGPQTPWGWIGIVPIITAFISFCPLYTLVGINTCKPCDKKEKSSKKEKEEE